MPVPTPDYHIVCLRLLESNSGLSIKSVPNNGTHRTVCCAMHNYEQYAQYCKPILGDKVRVVLKNRFIYFPEKKYLVLMYTLPLYCINSLIEQGLLI